MIEPKFDRGVNLEHWLSIANTNKSTGKVVLMDEQGVLYGHELLKDIAEGQEQNVKVFNGIKLKAFFAFLEVRYGQEPCVALLRNKESISNQDLERIGGSDDIDDQHSLPEA
jgi:hypothetical protein